MQPVSKGDPNISGIHTEDFSCLEIPTRFSSMSLIPDDINHKGSLSRSSDPSNWYITGTKSDLEAKSERSNESFETRAAKNTRIVSST